MNFEGFSDTYDFDDETGSSTRPQPPPQPPQFWSAPTPSDRSSSPSSILTYHGVSPDHFYPDSPAPASNSPTRPSAAAAGATVLPWVPSPPQSPSPPTLYATRRITGPEQVRPPAFAHLRNSNSRARSTQAVRFDEAQLAMNDAENADRPRLLRRELSHSSGQVTPGIDDTPFIQYALDALTREDGHLLSQSVPSSDASAAPQSRAASSRNPIAGLPPALAGPAPPATPPAQQYPAPPTPHNPLDMAAFQGATPSVSSMSSDGNLHTPQRPKPTNGPNRLPVPHAEVGNGSRYGGRYPTLDFKPAILRFPSFILLAILCLLMIAALILSAVYSKQHSGLLLYPGTLNSGHYFLFRILPQMLGAVIYFYAQAMIVTTFRVLPFERLAREDPRERFGALFQNLYPKSFLWPHLVGPVPVKVCIFVAWLMNFSLPLLSTLYNIMYLDGKWIWATVQGVAWALVGLYLVYLASLGVLFWFWHGRVTGMFWDVRSIADMVPMLHYSNTVHSYRGTQGLATRGQLRAKLHDRMIDRLGYWRFETPAALAQDAQPGSIWWGIGTSHDQADIEAFAPQEKRSRKKNNAGEYALVESVDSPSMSDEVRYRYLPWCMRNTQMIYFVAAGVAVLVTLLVVSFHPNTRLSHGFWPEVEARPDRNAFSPANFLYNFVPSILGQVLFLLFQALELSYRQLVPWAELSDPRGAPASRSILVDYAACLPLQSSVKALRNGHYRAALISVLSTLFIFLPILGGGLFMALTVSGTSDVRMFPSVPVFGVALALLGAYVLGLAAMLPGRGKYRLPHAVTCLAEIFSFVANEDATGDAAFRFPRGRADLLGRLGVGAAPAGRESAWYFGFSPGRDETLGVRREKRFTEKGPVMRPGVQGEQVI